MFPLDNRGIKVLFLCSIRLSDTLSLESHLAHHAYLKTLPPREILRTPLHFTSSEMEIFKGTNLYGAALDREREWRAEWNLCHAVVERTNPDWGNRFTWLVQGNGVTPGAHRGAQGSLLNDGHVSLISCVSLKLALTNTHTAVFSVNPTRPFARNRFIEPCSRSACIVGCLIPRKIGIGYV